MAQATVLPGTPAARASPLAMLPGEPTVSR